MARVYGGGSIRWHEDYEQGRPEWPAEVVSTPGLPPVAAAAEVGAGTGKLCERGPTRQEAGYDPSDLNPASYASGQWRQPFAGSAFGEFREARLTNPQLIDRDGLVAFFASMGMDG